MKYIVLPIYFIFLMFARFIWDPVGLIKFIKKKARYDAHGRVLFKATITDLDFYADLIEMKTDSNED